MEKIALVSLGCAKNLIDSEVMLGCLDRSGYEFTNRVEDSDIIIINTCGFIGPAREEALAEIRKAVQIKRKHPSRRIVVTGCYVQREQDFLSHRFPEVDVWMGVNDFDQITSAIRGIPYPRRSRAFLYNHATPRHLSTPPGWAYVKISEGCSHHCAFCAIPLIKGPYQSRTISSIAREVSRLVSEGIREINLVSQDTTFYGRDLGMKDDLPHLLKELIAINNLEWIRILYGYPEEITDSLLEIMQEEKICSYLDIPFQHSDTRIVRSMQRGLSGKPALELIETIRRKLPDVALRTSVIVGFPGEGKEEYNRLLEFVREARFDNLGVFTYSRESGTICFDLGDPIKNSVKQRRRNRLMELQANIAYDCNAKYLGRKLEVLIEGKLQDTPSTWIGRTRFQAPEVDGIVLITTTAPSKRVPIGEIHTVEITRRDGYDLYGELIK